MDNLLAALLMVWGNLSGANPDLTMEQVAAAALTPPPAIAVDSQTPPADGTDPLRPVNKVDPQKDAPKIKGIYSTAYSAGGARFTDLVKLLDDTELNAMVIDVKDDLGWITYKTGNPDLEATGAEKNFIPDIHKVMSTLQEHDIYPIARIVVFKDSILAAKEPALSFVNPDGALWKNSKKDSFVNPYNKNVWDYNIEVAKEAAKAGFKEIQFDYVRFAEGFETRADVLKYTKDDRTRIDAVSEFVKYAREQLNPLGVRVSVDIFGYAASVPAAEGIGQDFQKISENVDVISPMIYPSHYGTDWFGSKVPDAAPYKTIDGASKDTEKKLAPLKELKPVVRPWIQDFTATWVPGHITYSAKQVDDQIRALKDNGVEEFLLWNSKNRYTAGVDYTP
ncbi:putative glycoside hydrolase [Gorillibacterium massiliense]|uniref:putative glycoside hydrolase n=1 Tax=Gorillibacterium massiliense TaxID=1280390 RepID=UPI0004B88629|nr:putative glycoside hydrolase [Gorillibacterium massiliense]